MGKSRYVRLRALIVLQIMSIIGEAIDTNPVHDPCTDAKVQRWDGFTIGLAFSSKQSFYSASDQVQVQLSPCDTRLQLAGKAELAVFRPKVDKISLLTINSTFKPEMSGGYMVAFAGRKYAARSPPIFVADQTNTVTAFTLVLEFAKGTLQNLYWKNFGCESCKRDIHICTDNQECAVPTTKCKSNGGSVDCTISIQLTFSGTDKNDDVLNSWYEMKNMRRFSLYNLFSRLSDSLTGGLLKLDAEV